MKDKKLVLIVIVFLGTCLICSATVEKSKLHGTWKGTDNEGKSGTFTFYKDGSMRMVSGELVLDSTTIDGEVLWRLTPSESPMHLDIILKLSKGKETVLPMIVRFISETQIQIRKPRDNKTRPKKFDDSDKDNQIILTKQ